MLFGIDCKLYYSDTLLDGQTNKPDTVTWNEIAIARDTNVNMEKAEADATTRGSKWQQTGGKVINGTIETELLYKPGETAYTKLRDAFLNGTEIAILAIDGDKATVGNQGLASNCHVLGFSRGEPMTDTVKVNVTIKPSSFSEWYEVAAP